MQQARDLSAAGVKCLYREFGSGRPLLFLHGDSGPTAYGDGCLKALSRYFRVIAPWHPGFGPSEGPLPFRTVTDLAYFYMEFAERLGLRDAVLVGESFGGWISAELMISAPTNFSHVILVSPYGIKAGDHLSRDFVDLFATSPQMLLELGFANPEFGRREPAEMADEQLDEMVRGQISLAHFGWQPYMHNPQLIHWLHRIPTPALIVRGQQDRLVVAEVHEKFRDLIPGAQHHIVPEAGHFPNVEKSEEFAALVHQFVKATNPQPALA